MPQILQYWSRKSQLDALYASFTELEAIEDLAKDFLATNPPADASKRALTIIKAAREDRSTILEAIGALRSGSSPIIFRSGVIRQIKSVVVAYMALQMMIARAAAEQAAVDAELARIKNAMSMLDI